MAKCIHCGSETELFNNGVPVCVKCVNQREANSGNRISERQVHTILAEQLAEASARLKEAESAFTVVISEIPSGMPHPDGSQRVQNASREVSDARRQVMEAQYRLNGYLSRGSVPDDLTQSK
jgi:hypothetical protein